MRLRITSQPFTPRCHTMPLSDWPRTSAFQDAQPEFDLTADQFQAAVDLGYKGVIDPQSTGYWAATLDIPTLESTAGITLQDIANGLYAGRDSQDPDAMRSLKYLPTPHVNINKFMCINVEDAEAAMGITLLDLRAAIAAAA